MSDMGIPDPLEATLLDLLFELREDPFPLILGGGYGLYLRQRQVMKQVIESGETLLLSAIPPLRSTNDLDLFLRTELLADSNRLKPLRDALDRLGFTVILSAQNYQFARKFTWGDREWDIKVDLLAREPDPATYPSLKFDSRRIKPDPSAGIHAHTTPEAVAVEDEATPLTVSGKRTNGEEYDGTIYLPSSYAFLLMKLFALRDQWQVESKEFGRKHALDIYTIVALLTQEELGKSLKLRERYRSAPIAVEAGRIVRELFSSLDAPGGLRLREHPNFPGVTPEEAEEFLGTLTELFPEPTASNSPTDETDAP
jgi:hypothetical protein